MASANAWGRSRCGLCPPGTSSTSTPSLAATQVAASRKNGSVSRPVVRMTGTLAAASVESSGRYDSKTQNSMANSVSAFPSIRSRTERSTESSPPPVTCVKKSSAAAAGPPRRMPSSMRA